MWIRGRPTTFMHNARGLRIVMKLLMMTQFLRSHTLMIIRWDIVETDCKHLLNVPCIEQVCPRWGEVCAPWKCVMLEGALAAVDVPSLDKNLQIQCKAECSHLPMDGSLQLGDCFHWRKLKLPRLIHGSLYHASPTALAQNPDSILRGRPAHGCSHTSLQV